MLVNTVVNIPYMHPIVNMIFASPVDLEGGEFQMVNLAEFFM